MPCKRQDLQKSVEERTILPHNVIQTPKPIRDGKSKKKKKIRYLHDENDNDEEDEYAFTVKSVSPPETVAVTVGGIKVIDKTLWSKLKQEKIDCVSMKSDNSFMRMVASSHWKSSEHFQR